MTQKDAAMFPIIASAALFGLYIFFQVSCYMNVPENVKVMNNYSILACVKRLHQSSPYWLLLFLGNLGSYTLVESSCFQNDPCISSKDPFSPPFSERKSSSNWRSFKLWIYHPWSSLHGPLLRDWSLVSLKESKYKRARTRVWVGMILNFLLVALDCQ